MTNFIDLDAIAQQGPMFWVACLAVALGLAMIAAATVVQTRRLGSKFSGDPVKKAPVADPPVEVKRETPEVTPAVPVERIRAVGNPHQDPRNPAVARLEKLLGRLDQVSERLDLAGKAGGLAFGSDATPQAMETDLKEDAPGVEYVFRAAGS